MIGQAISLVGAALILAAFAAQQAGRLKPSDAAYLDALVSRNWTSCTTIIL